MVKNYKCDDDKNYAIIFGISTMMYLLDQYFAIIWDFESFKKPCINGLQDHVQMDENQISIVIPDALNYPIIKVRQIPKGLKKLIYCNLMILNRQRGKWCMRFGYQGIDDTKGWILRKDDEDGKIPEPNYRTIDWTSDIAEAVNRELDLVRAPELGLTQASRLMCKLEPSIVVRGDGDDKIIKPEIVVRGDGTDKIIRPVVNTKSK